MSEAAGSGAWPYRAGMAAAFVPLPRAAQPPIETLLLPFGALDLKARSTGFPPAFLRDAGAVIAATHDFVHWFAPGGIVVDFDYIPESIDEHVPVAGRVAAFAARADGVWGRIEWTARGRAYFAQRPVHSIATIFGHAKDGEIERILACAVVPPPRRDRRDGDPIPSQPLESLKC